MLKYIFVGNSFVMQKKKKKKINSEKLFNQSWSALNVRDSILKESILIIADDVIILKQN